MNQLPVEKMLTEFTHEADVLASAENWVTPSLFIVEKAIVIAVKTGINMNTTNAALIPQFSVNARTLGENSSFSLNPEQDMPDWYPPLFSNTIVSVPEVGEVVLILKENTSQSDKGWWIGRINDTDQISLKLAGSQVVDASSMEKYGLPFSVADVNKKSKQKSSWAGSVKYQMPARLGDVFIQGRSGSFLRNSYNPNYGPVDKPGVLEMGILLNKPYGPTKTPSVGKCKTKTIHLADAKPSNLGPRVNKVTVNDVDRITIDDEGGFYESRKNIIANFADDIYNVSTAKDAELLLHKQVLGEKLNNYLEEQDILLSEVMESLKGFAQTVEVLFNAYMDHTHAIPEINIDIPDKEVEFNDVINRGMRLEPREPIKVFVPGAEVSIPSSGGRSYQRTVMTPRGPQVVTETVAGRPGGTVRIPSKFVTVPQPPKPVNLGYRSEKRTKKVEFEKITIGGSTNPRMTTTVQSDQATARVQTDLNEMDDKFLAAKNNFISLIDKLSDNLSKRNYLN
tara:strand:+ start:149 stop:1675 length:1527 start_codon:yes stop_codon:yes gene_type:complete